jgi:hypothetical protein
MVTRSLVLLTLTVAMFLAPVPVALAADPTPATPAAIGSGATAGPTATASPTPSATVAPIASQVVPVPVAVPARAPIWRDLVLAGVSGDQAAGSDAPTATATPSPDPSATPRPGQTAVPAPDRTAVPAPVRPAPPRPDQAATPAPAPVAKPASYSMNLYRSGVVRYQAPDYTACVATSSLMMLNFIAYARTGGDAFRWHVTTSYAVQEAILRYDRTFDTQTASHPGTDAHGWKNGLNYFGYGSIRAGVYLDKSYVTYAAAAKAAIIAMAKYHKPVGILGWAGGHAQILNGYRVFGANPATGSTNFTIIGVYITDPLRSDGYRNHFISSSTWSGGSSRIRFARYAYRDNPGRDYVDHTRGTDFYGRWVIVAPQR